MDTIGVVVTDSMSWMEQYPPGEGTVEGVLASFSLIEVSSIQTIVHVSSQTESTGAICTELVEIVQSRGTPEDCFSVWVEKRV